MRKAYQLIPFTTSLFLLNTTFHLISYFFLIQGGSSELIQKKLKILNTTIHTVLQNYLACLFP